MQKRKCKTCTSSGESVHLLPTIDESPMLEDLESRWQKYLMNNNFSQNYKEDEERCCHGGNSMDEYLQFLHDLRNTGTGMEEIRQEHQVLHHLRSKSDPEFYQSGNCNIIPVDNGNDDEKLETENSFSENHDDRHPLDKPWLRLHGRQITPLLKRERKPAMLITANPKLKFDKNAENTTIAAIGLPQTRDLKTVNSQNLSQCYTNSRQGYLETREEKRPKSPDFSHTELKALCRRVQRMANSLAEDEGKELQADLEEFL